MGCPDCDGGFDRRRFVKTAVMATAGAALGAAAPKTSTASSETLVVSLHRSLSADQKAKIAFPFDHPLRSKVDNNWRITPEKIGEFFSGDQQTMIEEIFRGLHNPAFIDKVIYHMNEDSGGIGNYSIALFGEPGGGAFEFVLTGRHCTARCDGDSVEGAAFGGPIFYGHQAGPTDQEKPDHPNNVYWYQAKRANEVFRALDGKQRGMALLGDPRAEKATETVTLHERGEITGLPVSSMSPDQKDLVEKVLGDLLLPFRKKDTTEAMRYIEQSGGVGNLSMAFYKNADLGNDGVWDVWKLESPNMIWYFRGAPHVHTWVNIRKASV